MEPFTIQIADEALEDLGQRLARTRWPGEPEGGGWDYGANLGYMRRLVDYWRDRYDWRHWEVELNRLPHFRAPVSDGAGGEIVLHFIHELGSQGRPRPLLLSHGWPGSVVEFLDVIEPLAHPERFGGEAEDGFDVVAPSLPGYGFSDPPKAALGPRATAPLLHRLMRDVLGHQRYHLQGGDWGAIINAWIALDEPDSVIAAHFNMVPLRPAIGPDGPPLSAEEKAWVATARARRPHIAGYQEIQGTKSQTLAYGLTDSPVGLAAWIIEKFHGWTDESADEPPFTMDQLLTNVMVYWLTGSINTSLWLYRGVRAERSIAQPEGRGFQCPVGFCLPPNDLLAPAPESWLRRLGNVVHCTRLDAGGHFTALEKGPELIADIRAFFRAHGG